MQTNTLQKSVSQGSKKARQQTEKERRRTVQQTVRGGGSKAIYTALPSAQKAQYVRDLSEQYRKSQQKSGDLTKQTAAKKNEKSTYTPTSTIHYGSSGRAFGGSSGSFGEPSPYALRQQQKDEARQTIRERWLDYLGTAAVQSQRAAIGYVPTPSQQLSLASRQADNAQAIREARARFDEANQTIDWDGRSELTSALEELDRQSGWEINEEQANEIERERQKLLAQLRVGDYYAGNGVRSGTDADTGRDVVGSTAKGIAGAGVNLFSNIAKNLDRIDSYSWKPFDAVEDLWNGQEFGTTRRERIAAYEDPASQEKWKQIDAIADRLDYDAAQLLQRAKEGKSLAGEFGIDIAKNALEMSFDTGVALATGSSALVPMGARVYGQSVGTARWAGATLEQQTAYALTNTVIEVASERLFDGVAGIYGAGAADEITEELVRRLADTDAGRTLLRTVIGAAGEGTEEVVSDLLSPLAEAMVRNESVAELYRQLDPADVLYDYLIGFALGAFGSGANVATGRNAGANAELKARDADEAAYLRRMEEIGYLPAESSKNAAREGAEESLVSKTPQKNGSFQRGGIRAGMTEAERYEVLKDRTIRVVTDTKSAAEKESIDKLSLIPRATARAKEVLLPLAERLGILNRNMKTPEVDIAFRFSKTTGFKESINKQTRYGGSYVEFAKALINIDDILENAVLVEKHRDKYKGTSRADQTLESVSVLFGAFRDGKHIIPVQFEIKKSASYGGRLYLYVTLTKIEADVVERASSQMATDPSLVSASECRIADLFRKVNPKDGHFLKYLPDEMLTDLQKAAKIDALEEDRRRIDSYKKSEKS